MISLVDVFIHLETCFYVFTSANCVCGGILFSRCPSVHLSICYVLVSASYILLNNLRKVFIFCINVVIDKMLLLDKNKGLGVNSCRDI